MEKSKVYNYFLPSKTELQIWNVTLHVTHFLWENVFPIY